MPKDSFILTNCISAPCRVLTQKVIGSITAFLIYFLYLSKMHVVKLASHSTFQSNPISCDVLQEEVCSFSMWGIEGTDTVSSGYEGVFRLHYSVADMRSRNRSSHNADKDSHHNTNPFRDNDAPAHIPSLSKRLRNRWLSKG